MKMFRRLVASVLSVGLALALSGCAGSAENNDLSALTGSDGDDDAIGGDYKRTNYATPIYNAADQEIGSFECYNYLKLVNGCVLYTKVPDGAATETTREFRIYNIDKAEDHKLGTVEDCRYVASYEIIESDGHLYVSTAWGAYMDHENNGITIYDIDLLEYSMTPILTINGGISYDSYTVANNKLIVAEYLYSGNTDLVEYDLSEKHSSPVVHAYDESDYFTEGAIRHIFADDSNIYILRLTPDESEKYFLYLETYDFDYNLISRIDVRDFCVMADMEQMEDLKVNEWKQFVSDFFVHKDLVYYQNFSVTKVIGVMGSNNVNKFFETDSRFLYASETKKSGCDLFVEIYSRDENTRNTFYLVDPETHEVKTAKFYAVDTRYDFQGALRDGDKILLTMGYIPWDSAERFPERLYYLDMNELDFKTAE